MSKLIFWDVDTQHDFMKSDGKLYVPGGEEIIPAIKRLTEYAHANGITIIASADNHHPSDAEISASPDWQTTFPPHCMRGSSGQLKIAETALNNPLVIEPEPQDPRALAQRVLTHQGDILLHKRTVDVFTNPNVPVVLRALHPETIVLYGVATDFCDRYTVDGLLGHLPQAILYLVTDAIRAIYPEAGEQLIHDWKQRGVRMITSQEIVDTHALDPFHSTAYPAPSG